ncbi:TetR family transcriptional regulator [Acinetobacter sp. ANC 5054]|uniref:TetR/AcrR family transcriptional regulator n=1 Tax=Acinetobacter sp. ANC 5054 TaxID=1977877 RepID=UPI000A35B73E|nr:TetR/AcrR family transcriptional regulator [Acinetobacter sp. ANC 5054]OTG82569.1 TetR family transcriptional regulator [Acinetobacter sp. ANC 5054]
MQNLAHIEPLGLPQTRRGHERCVALLESATELFLKRGFEAVSLDDIVNHAGGSKASIYKYFGNKDGLFKAICDYRRSLFFKDICLPFNVNENTDIRAYLIRTLLNFHQHIVMPENAAFMRLIFEQTGRNPDIAQYIHEQGPKHIQNVIAEILTQAHEHGLIYCDNPLFSAQFYFGILRNLEWRILMGIYDPKNDQETDKYITYCVDRFLEGHQKR